MSLTPDALSGHVVGAGRRRTPVALEVEEISLGGWRVRVAGASGQPVTLELPLGPAEHVAGFGEQFSQVDKRGRVIDARIGAAVNHATRLGTGLDGGYKVAPLWHSSEGYAAWVEGTAPVRIDLGATRADRITVTGFGALALRLVPGTPKQALEVLTAETGRAPVPAPWAVGVWKASRGGHDATCAEARRLREDAVPASAIWLDAHYQPSTSTGFPCAGSYELGEYTDLPATVADLHALDFAALTYVNPWLYRDTPVHDEAVARGFAIADDQGTALYETMIHPFQGDELGVLDETGMHSLRDGAAQLDLANPAARAWWQQRLAEVLADGFDGWMQDFGEGVPGGPDGPAVLADGTPARLAHNRYPLLYHEAAAEVIACVKPDALFFARGGWLGAQAHAPVLWPGDQTRDWSRETGIGSVVAAGISLGLQGVACWGPDIGGCMGMDLGDGFGTGAADKELWQRWCQLGAMTPVMRDHLGFHTPTPVDLWTDDDTIGTWRRTARWHLSLFPYLYTALHEAARTGVPILRGLMVEFPEVPWCWQVDDQHLLGPALLCAPVLEPGTRTRVVRLPPGRWVDIWTDETHEGERAVTVSAPLERWPVLQRGGSLVACLLDPPLTLFGARFQEGGADLAVRVAGPPDGAVAERLHDGTSIEWEGERLRVRSPRARKVVATTPSGQKLAAGAGADVVLHLPPDL